MKETYSGLRVNYIIGVGSELASSHPVTLYAVLHHFKLKRARGGGTTDTNKRNRRQQRTSERAKSGSCPPSLPCPSLLISPSSGGGAQCPHWIGNKTALGRKTPLPARQSHGTVYRVYNKWKERICLQSTLSNFISVGIFRKWRIIDLWKIALKRLKLRPHQRPIINHFPFRF